MARTTARNQRNNPYAFDDLFVKFHRSAAGVAWRWRTEIVLLAGTTAGCLRLAHAITAIWALVAIGAAAVVAIGVRPARRFLLSRAWCVITRHRLQRVC